MRLRKPTAPAKAANSDELKYETKLNKGPLPIVITGWQDPSQIANGCVSSAELGAM